MKYQYPVYEAVDMEVGSYTLFSDIERVYKSDALMDAVAMMDEMVESAPDQPDAIEDIYAHVRKTTNGYTGYVKVSWGKATTF